MPPARRSKTPARSPAKPPVSRPSAELGKVLSLHAAKAEKVQQAAHKLEITHQRLIQRAEQNTAIASQIFNATLGVIACRDIAAIRHYVQTGLKDLLGVDAARFVIAGPTTTASTMVAEDIQALFPSSAPVILRRLATADDRTLYGPKGKLMMSDCLLHLTDGPNTMGLLALGSSDAAYFHAGQSTDMAAYLARVMGLCVGKLVT